MGIRTWFGRGRDGHRPIPASVLFWFGVLIFSVALPLFGTPWLLPWWVLLALGVTVVALWPGLSWASDQSLWWRPLTFALVVSAIAFSDGTGLSSALLVVALAQLVFAVGAKTTAFLAGAFLVVDGLVIRLIYRQSWTSTLTQVGSTAVIGGLIIAALHVAQRDRQLSEQTAELLAELRVTHAELAARSEQVRQLAISEERARLAREVHDAVGHHLTIVKLNLTNAQRLRHVDELAAWTNLAEAKQSAANALDEVRRAVRALGPGPLASTDLRGALDQLTTSYRQPDLAVGLDVRGEQRPLGSVLEASIYRLVEEGLTNVAKHAKAATRAEVLVYLGAGEITVSVSDDGRAGDELHEGFGLTGARERVAQLGGRFEILSEPEGVRLLARIPIVDSPVGQRA